MVCIDKNNKDVLETLDKIKGIALGHIIVAYNNYGTIYNTYDYPPIVPDSFKINKTRLLSSLRSPFMGEVNKDKLDTYFGTKFTESNVEAITMLYTKYRKELTGKSELLSIEDLDMFSKWLVDTNNSKIIELTGIDISSTNELKMDLDYITAIYASNPNKEISSEADRIAANILRFRQLFIGADFTSTEGIAAIKEYENKSDTILLENGVPKVYPSPNGLYILNTKGATKLVFPNSVFLLNPAIHSDLFGTIIDSYIKSGNTGDIVKFMSNYVSKDMYSELDTLRFNILEQAKKEVLADNPDIKGNELTEQANVVAGKDKRYHDAKVKMLAVNAFNRSIATRNSLINTFRNYIKNVGADIDEYSPYVNEDGVEVEETNQLELGIITAGEQFDKRGDETNPNKLVASSVRQLFLAVPKLEDNGTTIKKSMHYSGLNQYENASTLETLVRMELVNTFVPTGNNYTGDYLAVNELSTFDVMLDKLKNNMVSKKDNRLAQVIANIEMFINNPDRTDSEIDDFKKEFASSFTLVSQDYLMSIVSNFDIVSGKDIEVEEKDSKYTKEAVKYTPNTFVNLSNTHGAILAEVLEALPKTTKNNTSYIDFSALDKIHPILLQAKKSKRGFTDQDIRSAKEILDKFFRLNLSDYEVRNVLNSSTAFAFTKQPIYHRSGDGSKSSNMVPITTVLNKYANAKSPEERKLLAEDLINKNKTKDIFSNLINILNETRKPKQSNVYVIGGKSYYGFSDPSYTVLAVQSIKDGYDNVTGNFEGLDNFISDYFTGKDLEDEGSFVDASLVEDQLEDNAINVRVRRNRFEIVDDTAIKHEQGDESTPMKETNVLDSLVVTFLKFTNSNNSYNREGSALVDQYSTIFNNQVAADGSSSMSFIGMPNTFLGKFVVQGKTGEAEFVDSTMRLYAKKKVQQVLTRINNATKLIEGYEELKVLDEASVNSKLLAFNMDFSSKDLTYKRNFLLRDYALQNLSAGFHYSLVQDKKSGKFRDLSELGDVLTYEDFYGGTYYKGSHLNDIFVNMKNEDADSKETNGSYKYDIVRFKDDTYPDTKYPQLTSSVITDLEAMKLDKNASNNYDSAYNTRTLKTMYPLVSNELIELANSEYKKLDGVPVWTDANGESRTLAELPLDTIPGSMVGNANDRRKAIETAWKDFIIQYTIYTSEFTDFFNGGFDKYKQKGDKLTMDDPNKRMQYSTKATRRLINGVVDGKRTMTTYSGEQIDYDINNQTSIAIFSDIEDVNSRFIKEIQAANPGIAKYDMNIADAQSLASPEYHKAFKETVKGGWTSKDQAMHEALMDPTTILTSEMMEWLKGDGNFSTGGSVKTFTYGLNDFKRIYKKGGEGAFSDNHPLVIKTGLYFLYPAIVRGTGAASVLQAMRSQGVDILAAKSAIKSVNPQTTTIHKTENVDGNIVYTGIKEFKEDVLDDSNTGFRLNPFFINTSDMGLQQDTPNKGVYEGEAGKQPLKNMLAELDLASDTKSYFLDGKAYTAQEILDKIQDTDVTIKQDQLNKFLKQLYERDNQGDRNKLRELLINQLDPLEDMEEIALLRDPSIPITVIPNGTQRFLPVINKYIDKKVAQTNTNKSSAVQVADVGFSQLTSEEQSDVIFTSENRELTPPKPIRYNDLPKEDKLTVSTSEVTDNPIVYWDSDGVPTLDRTNEFGSTNKMRISKAKIMIPFKQLGLDMSWEQFKELYSKGKIDKDLFTNILAYRIPNQAMSSNDSVEIVGILPDTAGDAAVVYHEIVTKTGAAYDHNKLFMMMPSFDIIKDKTVFTDTFVFKKPNDFKRYNSISDTELLKKISEADSNIYDYLREKECLDNKGNLLITSPYHFIVKNQNELLRMTMQSSSHLFIDHHKVYYYDIIQDVVDSYHIYITYLNNKEYSEELSKRTKVLKSNFINGYEQSVIIQIEYSRGDTLKGRQNDLIRQYNAILESEDTYESLITPLDSDAVVGTAYYKDEIINKLLFHKDYNKKHGELPYSLSEAEYKKAYGQWVKDKLPSVLASFSPIERTFMRDDMLKAKNLVAIMANHMSDIAYSKLFKQALQYSFIDMRNEHSNKSVTTLYEAYISIGKDPIASKGIDVRNRLKQTTLVSWLMNAAVDAAKDNYIIAGNFNSYTAPSAMLMTRLGLSPYQVFNILSSDTILEITAANTNGYTKLSDLKNSEYRESDLQAAAYDLSTLMADTKLSFTSIFSEDNIANPDREIAQGFTVKQALMGLWGIVQPTGKAHSNALKLNKPDSDGPGNNLGENLALTNLSDVVREENAFIGTASKLAGRGNRMTDIEMYNQVNTFHTEIPKNYTALGATRNNGLLLANRVTGEMFLESSKGFKNLINDLSAVFGETLSTKADRLNLLANYTYTYLVAQAIDPLAYNPSNVVERTPVNMEALKIHTFKKLVAAKTKLSGEGSMFFQDLMFNKDTHTLFLPGKMNIDTEQTRKYRAELSLIENTDPSVTRDLAIYTLLESGFKSSMTSLHAFIPYSTLIRMGVGNKLESVRKAWADGDYSNSYIQGDVSRQLNFDDLVRTIAMNNPRDYRFVKEVKLNQIKTVYTIESSVLQPSGRYKIKASLSNLNTISDGTVIGNLIKKGRFNPFIKDKISASVIYFRIRNKEYMGYLEKHYNSGTLVGGNEELVTYKIEEIPTVNSTKIKVSRLPNSSNLLDRLTKDPSTKFSTSYIRMKDVLTPIKNTN